MLDPPCVSLAPFCNPRHVPMRYSIDVGNTYFSDSGILTFAVVRHPYKKYVSEWTWGGRIWKRLGYVEMNRFLQDAIHNSTHDPYIHDCHFIPQVDYIYDQTRTRQMVTKVLRIETLEKDLADVLTENGVKVDRPLFAPRKKRARSKTYVPPYFNLDAVTLDAIDLRFREDFKYLGYEPTRNLAALRRFY